LNCIFDMSKEDAYDEKTLFPVVEKFLKAADLNSVTTKQVRLHLESHFGADFSESKSLIDTITKNLFATLTHDESDDEPLKKKRKTSSPKNKQTKKKPEKKKASFSYEEVEDEDEMLARKLQEEERLSATGRPVRSASKKNIEKSEKAAASAKKREETRKRKKETSKSDKKKLPRGKRRGYVWLSSSMAEFMGVPAARRGVVTKKLWKYIKEKSLQNPEDRRQILCDTLFEELFKTKKFSFFRLAKFLSQMHFKDSLASDELEEISSSEEEEEGDENVEFNDLAKEVLNDDGKETNEHTEQKEAM